MVDTIYIVQQHDESGDFDTVHLRHSQDGLYRYISSTDGVYIANAHGPECIFTNAHSENCVKEFLQNYSRGLLLFETVDDVNEQKPFARVTHA